eukprot:gene8270-95_t
MIQVITKNKKYSKKKVKFITEVLMNCTKYPDFGVNIILTGDKTIKKLNKKDRNKNETTDVLSYRNLIFNEPGIIPEEDSWTKHLGEIYISMDYLETYCEQENTEMKQHLSWIVTIFSSNLKH